MSCTAGNARLGWTVIGDIHAEVFPRLFRTVAAAGEEANPTSFGIKAIRSAACAESKLRAIAVTISFVFILRSGKFSKERTHPFAVQTQRTTHHHHNQQRS